MDEDQTSAHDELRGNVRRLAESRIKPHAAGIDEAASFPVKSVEAFRALELAGLGFPEALGGSAGDLLTQVIVVEEIARVCASSASVLLTPWAALTPLVVYGSEELKARVVPSVARGESLASFCLTEPSGGSDLAGLKTHASRVAEGTAASASSRTRATPSGMPCWRAREKAISASSWCTVTIQASPSAGPRKKWA